MKSLKLVCCFSLIFAIVPAAHAKPVHKRPAPKTHAAAPGIAGMLQSFYNRGDAAANRKDLDGAMRYFSQDCKLIDAKGNEYDLGEIRFRLSTVFDSAKSLHSSTAVNSASQHGNIATAVIREFTTGVLVDPNTGKKAVLIDRTVARDTWTHSDDGWLITTSKVLSSQETLNGKIVTAPSSDDDQNGTNGNINDTPAFGGVLGNGD